MLSTICKLRELTKMIGSVVSEGMAFSFMGKFSIRICLVMPLRPFPRMGGVMMVSLLI